MSKPKIKTLQPRLQLASTSSLKLAPRIGATPRMRGGSWTKRRAKWLRQHAICCMCEAEGHVTIAEEVDHVVPLWQGGADDESNYQSLCKPHHAAKTAAEAAERGRAV